MNLEGISDDLLKTLLKTKRGLLEGYKKDLEVSKQTFGIYSQEAEQSENYYNKKNEEVKEIQRVAEARGLHLEL